MVEHFTPKGLNGEELRPSTKLDTWFDCIDAAPPRAAKLLLLLLPPRDREGMIGDLEEEYRTVLIPEYGIRTARFYYWWHAIQTCAFSVLCTIGKVATALAKHLA